MMLKNELNVPVDFFNMFIIESRIVEILYFISTKYKILEQQREDEKHYYSVVIIM